MAAPVEVRVGRRGLACALPCGQCGAQYRFAYRDEIKGACPAKGADHEYIRCPTADHNWPICVTHSDLLNERPT